MRDIVATIQPEQDDIVRAGADQTVCVQGAPGTGKTAVGLHRVAYLLYAYRERMSRGGVLVIGPNRAFLAYIRNVLPALGELDVTQLSVTDLLATVPVRGTDPEPAARIKGDARMAEVLRRALWLQLAEPAEAIMLVRGSRRWRVAADEIAELVDELRERGVRYGTGREMLSHRIAHVILTRMEAAGETCDDRTHEAVRRTRPVRAAVDAIWPKADPVRLVFRLLSDPVLLAAARRPARAGRAGRDRLGRAAPRAGLGPLVAGRRGADRRGARPDRAHAEPGPRRRRRGAGPVADGVPGDRPALRDRLGHRARRHRAGHHAVGHGQLAAAAGPPRQAGRRAADPGHRLPGAAADPGLRQPGCWARSPPAWARPARCARTRGRWRSPR